MALIIILSEAENLVSSIKTGQFSFYSHSREFCYELSGLQIRSTWNDWTVFIFQ